MSETIRSIPLVDRKTIINRGGASIVSTHDIYSRYPSWTDKLTDGVYSHQEELLSFTVTGPAEMKEGVDYLLTGHDGTRRSILLNIHVVDTLPNLKGLPKVEVTKTDGSSFSPEDEKFVREVDRAINLEPKSNS